MPFNKEYWDERYKSGSTGWDIGHPSTPLTTYFDQLKNRSLNILIPGAGNAYEAEYLHKKGFKNVYIVDWSDIAIRNIKKRIPDLPETNLIQADFFEHKGSYDLIIEQTFFCSLHPDQREEYVVKMKNLLNDEGQLAGVLFDGPLFDDHPPFGGNEKIYKDLFEDHFFIRKLERCYNSIKPRAGRELFILLEKNRKMNLKNIQK